MSIIIFYEKPGCVSNGKQKNILRASGYNLIEKDILNEHWTPEVLRTFFGELPIEEWFNQNAPAIKNNDIVIDELNEVQALEMMINDPILIRRPLMRLGDTHKVGFDLDILSELIDISEQYRYLEFEYCSQYIH